MSGSFSSPTLPTFSWIGHLKPDDRDLLSSYGEFFPGHPGTVIIQEGTIQTSVFVVISGSLEVRATQEDGSMPLLARVGPGETLGEISLFDPGLATATVSAAEFSQLWRISDSDLILFMEENPGAGNVLLRTLATILAQRLRSVNPKAFGISTYAVVESPELAKQPAQEPVPEPPSETGNFTPAPAESPEQPLTPVASEAPRKRVSTHTQAVPDLDELPPIQS